MVAALIISVLFNVLIIARVLYVRNKIVKAHQEFNLALEELLKQIEKGELD